jgi:phenylacetate-CoA ligase
MTVYNRIHRKVVWPLLERRSGISTKDHSAFLSKSETWEEARLREFQLRRLQWIIDYAYNNTVFYKQRFDELDLRPEDIRTFEDFTAIPEVTRDDLKGQLEKMISGRIPASERHFDATGGTTGVATRFVRDNECLGIKKASEYRFNRWAGWRPGEKILAYWPALADFKSGAGASNIAKHLLFTRYLKLFAERLNDATLAEHFGAYRKFRPDLIRTFPSALHRLGEYVERHGIRLHKPKAVICVGEALIESQRELIARVFDCPVFDCYVSRECGNIACECEEHDGMHIAEELIYLEIDSKANCGYGDILLTDLWNTGMPLLRYRIQDAGRWLDGLCGCGRPHRRIAVDTARLSDFLISPADGCYVSGVTLAYYLLAEGPAVGRTKIVQDAKNHVTVFITGDQESNRSGAEHIRSRLNVIFKGEMKVDFQYVNDIPLLKSGKYSFAECKIQSQTFAPKYP